MTTRTNSQAPVSLTPVLTGEETPDLARWARALSSSFEEVVGQVSTLNTTNSEYTKRVIITKAVDFPPTLDSNVQYFIDGNVDMGTRSLEVPAGGIHLAGYDLELSFLSSTEDNYTLFTSPVGGSGNVMGGNFAMTVSGTGSQVYDLVDATGFHAIEFSQVNYTDCTSLGTIDNYRQGLESGTGRFGGTPSLTLKGAWVGGFRITTSIVRSLSAGMTEPLFKAGAGFVMSSRFLSDINCDLPASAALLDFAPANFPNPSTLQLQGCEITRGGTYNPQDTNLTPNVDATNLCSAWAENNGLPNTFVGGRLVIASEAATVISTSGTWYTLNATTWTASNLAHFSNPSAGRLTNLGASPREYRAVVNFVIESTANNVIGLRLRQWDDSAAAFVNFTEVRRQVNNLSGARDVAVFNFTFTLSLDIDDYCYFEVRNNDSTANATLELDSDWFIEHR